MSKENVIEIRISGTAIVALIVVGIIAWLWFKNRHQPQIAKYQEGEQLTVLEKKPEIGTIGWPSK